MINADINVALIGVLALIMSVMVKIIPQIIQSFKELPIVNTKTKIIIITWVINLLVGVIVTLLFITFEPDIDFWTKVGYGIMAGILNGYGVKLEYDKSDMPSLKETVNNPPPEPPLEKNEVEPIEWFKLALDAGHGLPTSGRRTLNGTQEWSLNNAVLLKLEELAKPYAIKIKRFDDVTGKTDKQLMKRINEANDWKADFFYSRHHNGFTEEKASGVEIYHPFSNAEIIAKMMVDKEAEYTGLPNRGTKTKSYPGKVGVSYFAVNRETNMPGVLGEGGFMTTTKDMKVIESEEGQYGAARAILESLVEYYDIPML